MTQEKETQAGSESSDGLGAGPISILCADRHGKNPQIMDCPKCVEEERDRFREALERLTTRAESMMQDQCWDPEDWWHEVIEARQALSA